MNISKPNQADIIKALTIAGDRDFIITINYMKNSDLDLRRDGKEAREWCASEARGGDPMAQFALAKLCFIGLWGKESKEESLLWCQKSERSGFIPAKLMLSRFYESGLGGLDQDLRHASQLRMDAAESGYPPAMHAIAVGYLLGVYGNKDRDQALMWLRRAAEIGDAQSQFLLASELFKNGDEASISEGDEWIRSAADQGHPGAHYSIGSFYWDGTNGFPEDKEKSSFHLNMSRKLEEDSYATLI